MRTLADIRAELETFKRKRNDETFETVLKMDRLVEAAFLSRENGHIEASEQLLNQALDYEFTLTFDCETLGPLADEWGVDETGDRERPSLKGVKDRSL